MSPYCFLPNCRRLGDLLFATASSMCLRTQHKGQNFSQKILSVGSSHADSGHANHWMLCICCLQTSHSSNPVCAAALQRNIPFMAPPPWSRKEHDASTWMGNTLAVSGVFTTKLEMGDVDVGRVQGTCLTSRMFRDPDSLKEGLQRKFICRKNTGEEPVKPSYLKKIYWNLLHYSKVQNVWSCLVLATKHVLVTEQNGAWGPNHITRSSFWYCLLRRPLSAIIHCGSSILLCFSPRKGCYSFASCREGLTGSTHFLQLFDAGCMHYNLAGCTLAPGERFLLKGKKRGEKIYM